MILLFQILMYSRHHSTDKIILAARIGLPFSLEVPIIKVTEAFTVPVTFFAFS